MPYGADEYLQAQTGLDIRKSKSIQKRKKMQWYVAHQKTETGGQLK